MQKLIQEVLEEEVSVSDVKLARPDKKGSRSRTVSPRECLDALRR